MSTTIPITLPQATKNEYYEYIFSLKNSPCFDASTTFTYKFYSGSLPIGVSFNQIDDYSFSVTGTPTTDGDFNFQINCFIIKSRPGRKRA